MFFKRNAESRQEHSKCHFNGHCEINSLNRHLCSSCRLVKCFESGMQIQMLRSSIIKKNKTKRKIKETERLDILTTLNNTNRTQNTLNSNRLQSAQSTFSINDWNLLSNLTQCYDELGGFSLVQDFIREQNSLPPKARYKRTSVSQLILSLIGRSQLFYENNTHFISLCSHDRSILVHSSMKYIGSLGACFIIRNNDLWNNLIFYKSAENFYRFNTLAGTVRILNQLDFDSTFLKLALAILVFSTFDYTYYNNLAPVELFDIKTILHIQNIYAELAWQYLTCKYNHKQAVVSISTFIRCLFFLNDAIIDAIEIKQYKDMIDSVIQQTKKTITLCE
ncbi:unnamed protein product [Rotaria magnacalcarata]|nr:unnamed protein product [Rotaria magnacalcarata]CAF1628620.1 unnamed protein product [Rotaria magnacalcarata]CAF4105428.1 unnamed protein product [Rotaria magnacalcarata]CAF4146642.1 unnamed protein product [Rotaria magnacalcarata]